MARDLNGRLPEGYLVDVEQSLQIREIPLDTGERLHRPQPDLTVYRQPGAPAISGGGAAIPTLTQSILETIDLDEDLYYAAVVIYRLEGSGTRGRAVTRIELLSPTNKEGDGAIQYREKRITTLKSGLALVEIDLLHETPPVIRGVPRYPTEPGSTAYRITISDLVPSFASGLAQTYAFPVDSPIPALSLPMGAGQTVRVEWQSVYDETFRSLRAYSQRVDYAERPPRFDRYSSEDQARILARMSAVQNA